MSYSRQQLYLHQVRISNVILQFDVAAGRGLSIWRWYDLELLAFVTLTSHNRDRPVNDVGERVTPSDLDNHRLSHRFLGPCCICPAINNEHVAFTETAITVVLFGRRAGQYVARCATGGCGYLGESLTV